MCLQPHNFELIVRRLEVQVFFSSFFFAYDYADLWLFCRAQSMSHSEKCAHYFNFPLIIGLALLVNCQSQNTQYHLCFIDFSVLFVANREKMKDSKEKSISWTRYWQWSSSVSQKKKAIINRARVDEFHFGPASSRLNCCILNETSAQSRVRHLRFGIFCSRRRISNEFAKHLASRLWRRRGKILKSSKTLKFQRARRDSYESETTITASNKWSKESAIWASTALKYKRDRKIN